MPASPVIHHSIGSPDSSPGTPNYEDEFFPDDFVAPAPEELSPIRRLVGDSFQNQRHKNRTKFAEPFNPEDLNSSLFENSDEELIASAPEVKEVRLASRPPTPGPAGTGKTALLTPRNASFGNQETPQFRSPRDGRQSPTVMNGRRVVVGHTDVVVKQSNVVVGHSATASEGWCCAPTPEGRLYFYLRHHPLSSQWTCPTELFPYFPHCVDASGSLPASIFHAAFAGAFAYLHAYWRVGGNFRMVDHLGRSALHFAAAGGHADVIEWLLEVDMEILPWADKEGSTAVSLGCRYGHGVVVKMLVQAGAAVSGRDVMEAEVFGGSDLAGFLLAKKSTMTTANTTATTATTTATTTVKDDSLNMSTISEPVVVEPRNFFQAVKPVFIAIKNRFFG